MVKSEKKEESKSFADRLGPEGQVIFSAAGIYFFYLYYGILQERIYKPDPVSGDKFEQTLFLLTVQCFANFLLGWIALVATGSEWTRKPASENALSTPLPVSHNGGRWLEVISASYMGAMACSNESLQYVSYPFQALAKSCKMVPVMLANVLIGKKRYSLLEYAVVFSITAGVVLFKLGDSKASFMEGNTPYGMMLLFLSLCLDGFTSSNQKLFSDEYKPSSHYMMMMMNLKSLLLLLPVIAFTGDGVAGLEYCLEHSQTMYDIVMFSICSAIGQQFIFFCVVGPGPLVCTTITTTRKFFTVLLSVVLYPENSLTNSQWLAVLLVFGGLTLELVHKRTKSAAPKKKAS